MNQRIISLTRYLIRLFARSFAGFMTLILAFAFYFIFFNPQQQTPDWDYFFLMWAGFGALYSFLTTFLISNKAEKMFNLPLIGRLPSRIEYLAAILFASLIFSTAVQFIFAILSWSLSGPSLTLNLWLTLPPIWLSLNLFMATLALHATDLISLNWSRIYVYLLLTTILFSQTDQSRLIEWVTPRAYMNISTLRQAGWTTAASYLQTVVQTLQNQADNPIKDGLAIFLWPFHTLQETAVTGSFTLLQTLAPAILIFYATLLFLYASETFAHKDIHFTE